MGMCCLPLPKTQRQDEMLERFSLFGSPTFQAGH